MRASASVPVDLPENCAIFTSSGVLGTATYYPAGMTSYLSC
jgi:hypothetical protein